MKKHVVISRTDSIGDLILTLPMAYALKSDNPQTQITFLCSSYAAEIAKRSQWVDGVVEWQKDPCTQSTTLGKAWVKEKGITDIIHVFPKPAIAFWAWKLGIPHRRGTWRRWYHLPMCTHFSTVSRSGLEKHEALFNLDLLEGLVKPKSWTLENLNQTLPFGLAQITKNAPTKAPGQKTRVVLHPKSKGSAREWPLESFLTLAEKLAPEYFDVYVTGTKQEGLLLKEFFKRAPAHVKDMTGQFSLGQFIDFLGGCHAIVAASTGPLHIGAALGLKSVGVYPYPYPINATRWGALGPQAVNISPLTPCTPCQGNTPCPCMAQIKPEEVAAQLQEMCQIL